MAFQYLKNSQKNSQKNPPKNSQKNPPKNSRPIFSAYPLLLLHALPTHHSIEFLSLSPHFPRSARPRKIVFMIAAPPAHLLNANFRFSPLHQGLSPSSGFPRVRHIGNIPPNCTVWRWLHAPCAAPEARTCSPMAATCLC